VSVIGQGVPDHIGTPTPGYGYEDGDPYAGFLPPAVPLTAGDEGTALRAMVIVTEHTEKVGQEYIGPVMVLSGEEYVAMPFHVLHDRICDALRGRRPRLIAEAMDANGSTLIFEDGSVQRPTDDDNG
jgi:hypothetical protein